MKTKTKLQESHSLSTCCARDGAWSNAVDAYVEVAPLQGQAAGQAVNRRLHCTQAPQQSS